MSKKSMHNGAFLTKSELLTFDFAELGENVLIHRTCVLISCDRIRIGSNVRIDPFCILSAGKSLRIGSNVHIAGHCLVSGKEEVHIGDFSGVSHGSKILSSTDDFQKGCLTGPTIPDRFRSVASQRVVLGRHAVVGANCVVLPGSVIGDGATIGALSLVKSAVDPWTVSAGSPLRLLGERDQDGVLAAERAFLKADR